MLLGLNTFGDLPTGDDGALMSHPAAIRQVVEEAVLADQLGIDAIGLGEHHRPEYAISTPETVLAGIATRTERITLGSAVTVLSTDDPVRVHQRFATVDALSGGRAEAILGRGSFTESYPLFGFDLSRYDLLFEEKLDLFVKLLDERPVTWSGATRPALVDTEVFPKTESGRLRTWVGVGGSPQSVVRTARHGLRLMLAVIGGGPARFRGHVDLYRRAAEQLGTVAYPVGLHSPGFVADTDAEAHELFYPHYKKLRDTIGPLRGLPPLRREEYEAEVAHGSLYIGSPETVARKMARAATALDVGRFDLIYSIGAQHASARMRAVELFGTKVFPMVRDMMTEN
jgi:probable LLM family oxidoreductase